VNKDPKDSVFVYLPERYRQQVETKKRRRFIKKIFAFSSVVIFCCVLILIVGGILSNHPIQPLLSPTGSDGSVPESSLVPPSVDPTTPLFQNVTAVTTTVVTIYEGQPTTEFQSLENAAAFLRLEYPSSAYTVLSANESDQFPDRSLYEFKLKKITSSPDNSGFSVFIDAGTGEIYTPGQEKATITSENAKTIAREMFPLIHTDSVKVRYNVNPDSVRAWIFTMFLDNITIITGSIDPETGQILSFTRSIPWEGRQADPLLDVKAARKIADRYILDKNRISLHLNMTEVHYIPLQVSQKTMAGHYDFIYNRIIQEIPCDKDGLTISVDSLNGEVTGYDRRWNSPDSAFSIAMDPLVTRSAAISAVLKKAEETYPSSLNGITIISAETRWKDDQPLGTIPRPGSISQAWKVIFTDDIIREKPSSSPAVAWIDIQTGKILDFSYEH
jgi:hypothetical protein